MEKEIFNKHLKFLTELANQKSEKLYAWFKQVLLMASGLLSILVALHQNRANSPLEHKAYVISILSLAIGISVGSIFLFSEVNNAANKQKRYAQKVSKLLNGETRGDIMLSGKTAKIFVLCEWLTYLSFLSALTSLCAYAILSDKSIS